MVKLPVLKTCFEAKPTDRKPTKNHKQKVSKILGSNPGKKTGSMKDFFWVFLRGLVSFFLKNNFSEIFIFAILLLCTLLDWVRHTIQLGPVHYLTGVWYTIQLESGTLFN